MEAKHVATVFVDAINSHDVEALCLLMTECHVFVDSCGRRFSDSAAMRQAWRDTFRWFANYRIEVERIIVDCNFVVLIGTANGTTPTNECWSMPSVWTAQIEGSRISEWRVYADSASIHRMVGN
jgi:ketosteroid isomerase-like protein